MTQMTRGLCLALAASLTLVGCGQIPTRHVDVPSSDQSRTASASLSSQDLARDFAKRLSAQGIKATARGSVVTAEGAAGDVVSYDFRRTPQTGKVVFRAGEYVTEIDYPAEERVSQRVLIMVAVKMIWGGTKAYLWYRKSHPGNDFDRNDCVKAVVYGMIAEGVSVLPGGVLLKRLTPIVWKWIVGEDPIAPSPQGVFARGLQFRHEIARALEER